MHSALCTLEHKIIHTMAELRQRKTKLVLCDHCGEMVAKRTFYSHRKKYSTSFSELWQTERDRCTDTQAMQSGSQYSDTSSDCGSEAEPNANGK